MRFLERLFGRADDEPPPDATTQRYRQQNAARAAGSREELTADEQAIERYRYLLRTAPPETIEEAHAEAFAQLTPEQRRLVLEELSREVPERELAGDRAMADDPRRLARLATRAEMRSPGTLERTFARADAGYGFGGPGIGLGGLMAGSFLSSIAGVVIGTAIADAFFLDSGYDQGFSEGFEAGETASADSADPAAGETGDSGFGGTDPGAEFDASSLDAGYADAGADIGGELGTDFGGDFGRDFDGGDFGGEF